MKVRTEKDNDITIVTIDRPEVRNAIDWDVQTMLADAFRAFEADANAKIAILTGAGGQYSAGGDLKAFSKGEGPVMTETGDSPIGVSRMKMTKPVIAAVEGYAVAGGMALACWCDMRVVAMSAKFGMLDRRFGVPIVGGVTVTLPRLIGMSHAMDLVLTGRMVDAEEAYRMGLANRLVDDGEALNEAIRLGKELASYPWEPMLNDRKALIEAMDLTAEMGHINEFRHGIASMATGKHLEGAARFEKGEGRHGKS